MLLSPAAAAAAAREVFLFSRLIWKADIGQAQMRHSKHAVLERLQIEVRWSAQVCDPRRCFWFCWHDRSKLRLTFNLRGRLPPSQLPWNGEWRRPIESCKRVYWHQEQRFCILQPCYGSKRVSVSGWDIRSCFLHSVSVKCERGGVFVFQARGGQRPLLTLNPISLGIN